LRELRAAWMADPAYLSAFVEAVFVGTQAFLPPALARELDSLAGAQPDSVLGQCLRSLLAFRNGAWAPIDLRLRGSAAARTCVAYHRFVVYPSRQQQGDHDSLTRFFFGARFQKAHPTPHRLWACSPGPAYGTRCLPPQRR
jgi:hypothetical protein